MSLHKRVIGLLAFVLGLIGVLVGLTALVGVWFARAHLSQTVDNVFEKIDGSLIVVGERVGQTRERVQAARITTEGIEETLKEWAKRESRDRLTSRLGVEEKAKRLASGLQQADHWLELSESSVQLMQQALVIAGSAGAPVETDSADRLLEDLASLRGQLAQATESLKSIRERTAAAGSEVSLEERVDQAVRLALRVIATLSSVDSRLEAFDGKLSEVKTRTQSLKAKTHWWILLAAICISLVTVWLAAGQCSLCLHGWKGFRQRRNGRPPGQEASPAESTGSVDG